MNRFAFRRALRRELGSGYRGLRLAGILLDGCERLEMPPPLAFDVDAPGGEQTPAGDDVDGEPDTEPPALDPAPSTPAMVAVQPAPGAAMPSSGPAFPDWPSAPEPRALDPARPAPWVNPHRAMALARLARRQFPPRPIDRSRLPIAASREACPRCGVRGDLGCDHQRAFEG